MINKEDQRRNKDRISTLKTKCSEDWARWQLEDKGYIVVKILKNYKDKKENKFKYELYEDLIIEALKHYDGDSEALFNFIKENYKGLPDFLCIKGDKIKFVEVKSCKQKTILDPRSYYYKDYKVRNDQRIARDKLKEKGIDVEYYIIAVNIGIKTKLIFDGNKNITHKANKDLTDY